jgi:hypothetical protein
LVVRPPRDRPSASRAPTPGFLSFGSAPCGAVGGRSVPGSSRVLMRPSDGGIRAHRPVLPLGLVTTDPQPVQDLLPRPVHRPAAMPPIDGLPVPVPRRKITPGAARTGPEDDPVDDQPMVQPPTTPSRNHRGQERPKPLPLLIGQVMTIQQIRHRTDLQEPPSKIHQTRPNVVHAAVLRRGNGLRCSRGP